MAMNKENSVTLTGIFRTEQVTATFEKTMLTFASKDRDGQWKDGDLEMYLKPELVQQSGAVPGDTIKIKGFFVFNFFTKADGVQMSFPKVIATEVVEVEKAGAAGFQGAPAPQGQPQAQPTQPNGFAGGVPPMPGAAPTAPGVAAPAYTQPPAPAQPQYAAPVPPAPGQPV